MMASARAKWNARFSALASLLVIAIPAAFADPNEDLIEKGKYLTTAGGCLACHQKPGGEPFAGGRPIQTPFGSISSPNITPDKETGIGNYDDDKFYRAMHEGLGEKGEYLYPVFPFTSYTKVTRDDVLAIKAYLFSLKPVHSPREASSLPFPYNIRASLLVWRELFFKAGEFKPDPQKSAQINRGAYLVDGLEHCGECHTKRNWLGGSEKGALQGGSLQGWYAPNITSDWATGIGSWSEDELFGYLKTGSSPKRGVASGPMAEVVHENLKLLTDDDVRAMAVYLKSTIPEAVKAESGAGTFEPGVAGAGLYVSHCASCHQLGGQGIEGKIPPLAENGSVTAAGPENVVKVMIAGLPASGNYGPMPSYAAILDDGQIASVANYVRTAWSNKGAANADSVLVSTVRKGTKVMLALGEGGSQCPVDMPAGQKAVVDKANAEAQDLLQSTRNDNLAAAVGQLVPRMKAALPDASPADIVNGLTVAFCPSVEKQTGLSLGQKRELLDMFSQLAYTQAVAGNVAGPSPEAPKKAGLN